MKILSVKLRYCNYPSILNLGLWLFFFLFFLFQLLATFGQLNNSSFHAYNGQLLNCPWKELRIGSPEKDLSMDHGLGPCCGWEWGTAPCIAAHASSSLLAAVCCVTYSFCWYQLSQILFVSASGKTYKKHSRVMGLTFKSGFSVLLSQEMSQWNPLFFPFGLKLEVNHLQSFIFLQCIDCLALAIQLLVLIRM